MNINDALKFVNDGKSLLFTGAGFSFGAENSENIQIPLGDMLLDRIKRDLGKSDKWTLEEAAEELFISKKAEGYTEFLKLQYICKKIAPYHETYAKFPWMRIYTTNFDDVIEKSYDAQGKDIKSLIKRDQVREVSDVENTIIHLNGDINKATPSSIREDITLSEMSYIMNTLERTPWATQFRFDTEIAQSIFFVGYSMFDLDIKRMLYENTELKLKTFFILESKPDDGVLRRIKNYGTPVLCGVDGFSSILEEAKRVYIPVDKWIYKGYSFQRIEDEHRNIEISADDVYSLLFYGNYKRHLIHSSIAGGKGYYVNRKIATNIIKELKSGKIVCINSYLGNGKTLLLEELCYSLAISGYSVFLSNRLSKTALADCQEILANEERVVFVFDNYPDWMRIIEYLSKNSSKETNFIFAARTTAHEMYIESIVEYFDSKKIFDFKVNQLGTDELANIDMLLKDNGLWGDYSSKSVERRIDYLCDDCNSEFHGLLLKILESKTISEKLERIFTEIHKRFETSKMLTAVLLLNYLGEHCTGSILMDIFGPIVNDVSVKNNLGIKEIFDDDHMEVRLKSSVASYYILKRIVDKELILETLENVAFACDSRTYIDEFRNLFKKIMRLALVTELFGKQRIDLILEYYNYCKGFKFCANNPQFWLQYAMACIEIKEYDRADKHFKTSYGYASSIHGYDLYQIDNHYAKYLLIKAIEVEKYPESYNLAIQAMEIVMKQVSREYKKQPYSVSLIVYDYWTKNEQNLTTEQKRNFDLFARRVIESILKLPEYLKSDQIIVDSLKKMEKMRSKINIRK